MADGKACAQCVFYIDEGEKRIGRCRRFPPVAFTTHYTIGGSVTDFVFPHVRGWCGEFSARAARDERIER